MLVLRNVFSSGKRAGIVTTLGISCGLLIYASLSALGISIIITQSKFLYQVLKLIGVAYLIYLGILSLLPIIKNKKNENIIKAVVLKNKKTDKRSFTEGLLSNLFNPKIAVFYLTFLPQFINPNDNVLFKSLFLASIHVVLGVIWLTSLSVTIGSIRYIYTSSKFQQTLEAISGTVMILFAILLLFERK